MLYQYLFNKIRNPMNIIKHKFFIKMFLISLYLVFYIIGQICFK